MTKGSQRVVSGKPLFMIAYKYKDYAVFFSDEDVTALTSGAELCVSMQNYLYYEPLLVRLVDLNTIRAMITARDRQELFFFNESEIAVVEISDSEPTQHTLTFETLWFQNVIEEIRSQKRESTTIRWGADKITILADPSREAQRFKALFGP